MSAHDVTARFIAGQLQSYAVSRGVPVDLAKAMFTEGFLSDAVLDRFESGQSWLAAEKEVQAQIDEFRSEALSKA